MRRRRAAVRRARETRPLRRAVKYLGGAEMRSGYYRWHGALLECGHSTWFPRGGGWREHRRCGECEAGAKPEKAALAEAKRLLKEPF